MRIACAHSLSSRPGLLTAMDHSSGSIGGMPAVCIIRWRRVTASCGCPGTRNAGKYLHTGSSRESLPSHSRMQMHRDVMDLDMDAMPNIVSILTGVPAASRWPYVKS